jgi:hypothetical protein
VNWLIWTEKWRLNLRRSKLLQTYLPTNWITLTEFDARMESKICEVLNAKQGKDTLSKSKYILSARPPLHCRLLKTMLGDSPGFELNPKHSTGCSQEHFIRSGDQAIRWEDNIQISLASLHFWSEESAVQIWRLKRVNLSGVRVSYLFWSTLLIAFQWEIVFLSSGIAFPVNSSAGNIFPVNKGFPRPISLV